MSSTSAFTREVRLRDYVAALKLMVGFIAMPAYVLYTFLDFAVFGWRLDFLLCGVQFFTVSGSVLWALCKGWLNNNPSIGFRAVLLSNFAANSYQVALTGGQASEYNTALGQALMVCMVLPLFRSDFILMVVAGFLLQAGAFLYAAEGNVSSILAFPLINSVVYCFIATLVFLSLERLRSRLYHNLAQNADLMASQSETIAKQAQALARAQTASAIGRAAQMLVHDVRRPLTLLRSLVSAMKETPSARDREALLVEGSRDVDRALAQVDAMVDDVLEASTERPLVVASESLARILVSSLDNVFAPRSESAPAHTLVWDLGHARKVSVDATRLARAFTNVIANAVEATPRGARLWFTSRAKGNDRVEVVIGNSGSTIRADALDHLFDDYFTEGKVQGTGLGLAITKRVVERHGGRVTCRTGTSSVHSDGFVEFVFEIPCLPEEDFAPAADRLPDSSRAFGRAALAACAPDDNSPTKGARGDRAPNDDSKEVPTNDAKRIPKPRVVVVDDTAAYRTAWRVALSKDAIPVCFASPDEALAAWEARDESQWDAVIVDLDFGPEASMDGVALARALREAGFVGRAFLCTNGLPPEIPHSLGMVVIPKAPCPWSQIAQA